MEEALASMQQQKPVSKTSTITNKYYQHLSRTVNQVNQIQLAEIFNQEEHVSYETNRNVR